MKVKLIISICVFFCSCINSKKVVTNYVLFSLTEQNGQVFQNRTVNDSTIIRQSGYCEGGWFSLRSFKLYKNKVDTLYISGDKFIYYFERNSYIIFSKEKFTNHTSTMFISKYKYGNGHYLAIRILEPDEKTKIDEYDAYIYKTTNLETFQMESYEFYENILLKEKKYADIDPNYKIHKSVFIPERAILLTSVDSFEHVRILESSNAKRYYRKFSKEWKY